MTKKPTVDSADYTRPDIRFSEFRPLFSLADALDAAKEAAERRDLILDHFFLRTCAGRLHDGTTRICLGLWASSNDGTACGLIASRIERCNARSPDGCSLELGADELDHARVFADGEVYLIDGQNVFALQFRPDLRDFELSNLELKIREAALRYREAWDRCQYQPCDRQLDACTADDKKMLEATQNSRIDYSKVLRVSPGPLKPLIAAVARQVPGVSDETIRRVLAKCGLRTPIKRKMRRLQHSDRR